MPFGLNLEHAQLCDDHIDSPHGFRPLDVGKVVRHLRRAKDKECDPQLILLDVRETRVYQAGHILSAHSMSCHTKTMAKRAVASWNSCVTNTGSIANSKKSQNEFISNGTVLLVYDHHGRCPFCEVDSPVAFFINALLSRGYLVNFLMGGYEAFRRLPYPDLIVRGPPSTANATVISSNDAVPNRVNRNFSLSSCSMDAHRSRRIKSIDSLSSTSSVLAGSAGLLTNRNNANGFCWLKNPYLTVVYNSSRVSTNEIDGRLDQPSSTAELSPDCAEDVLNASVSEIFPFLYIGNARDAQNHELLSKLGITHIINVTDTVPMPFRDSAEFEYLHLPAADTTRQNLRPAFESGVQFIDEACKSNGIVLVHCQAGVSRSVAVVMAFILNKWPNFNVIQAFEFIQARRPVAAPNLHFFGQLKCFHDDLHSEKISTD